MEACFFSNWKNLICKSMIWSSVALKHCQSHRPSRALRATFLTRDAILDLHFSPRNGDCFAVATSTGHIDGYSLDLAGEEKIIRLNSHQVCDPSILVLSFTWFAAPANSKDNTKAKDIESSDTSNPTEGNIAADLKKKRRRRKRNPTTHLGNMELIHNTARASSSPEVAAMVADEEDNEGDDPSEDGMVLAFSLSNGRVGYIAIAAQQLISSTGHAHSLEAWMVAWSTLVDSDSIRTLYSGGDDSAFCRNNPQFLGPGIEPGPYQHMSRDIKTHEAGVTAILPIPNQTTGAEVVLTGSYDEHIRVLVFPENSKKPKLLAEQRLQGGVWRLKVLDLIKSGEKGEISFRVLASCMHAGARVVKVERSDDKTWSIRVLAKFTEHESMNYASDARDALQGEYPGVTVVSTSFYDRKLCVWNIEKR